MHVVSSVLEPQHALVGRSLIFFDYGFARFLVSLQSFSYVRSLVERLFQRDRVFHRQFGARADREMRGMQRVTEQHHVLVTRSEEHTSELQSRSDIVCRLLLEKKKKQT